MSENEGFSEVRERRRRRRWKKKEDKKQKKETLQDEIIELQKENDVLKQKCNFLSNKCIYWKDRVLHLEAEIKNMKAQINEKNLHTKENMETDSEVAHNSGYMGDEYGVRSHTDYNETGATESSDGDSERNHYGSRTPHVDRHFDKRPSDRKWSRGPSHGSSFHSDDQWKCNDRDFHGTRWQPNNSPWKIRRYSSRREWQQHWHFGYQYSSVAKFTFIEKDGDLFTAPESTSLAHCVAEDLRMGKGIAVTFRRKFNSIKELHEQNKRVGDVAILGNNGRFVYYLITKKFSTGKPSLEDLRRSLCAMKKHCKENNVTEVAMPRIGCGLDRLQWRDVKSLVKSVFSDLNMTITIYNFTETYRDISSTDEMSSIRGMKSAEERSEKPSASCENQNKFKKQQLMYKYLQCN